MLLSVASELSERAGAAQAGYGAFWAMERRDYEGPGVDGWKPTYYYST